MCFAPVIIFCRQGSFKSNQCKWPMYAPCFINSHWSLFCQQLLCLIRIHQQDLQYLVFFACSISFLKSALSSISLSASQCLPLAFRIMGTPTLQMAKSFWDGLLQPLPRSWRRGQRERPLVHVSSILCINISAGRELQKYFLKIKCCCLERNIKYFPTPISTFSKGPRLAIILLTLQKCSIR